MWVMSCEKVESHLIRNCCEYSNNNNNQVFYYQTSWGSLEMKPNEKKNRYKTRVKNKEKTKGDKK
jgi:hypothetical protein